MKADIVPANIKGKNTDLQHSVTLPTREEAVKCFNRAHKRLLNPPLWHELCGVLSASFMLIAEDGYDPHRLAEVDDYFRIDTPGPGNIAGNGYDWVRVEAIEDETNAEGEEESFAIRVRASQNPDNKKTTDTAHFFEQSATSSFVITRAGNEVTAFYHGRNELPNTHTDKTTDNVRNALVAFGGFAGLSEAQWYALIKGLLQEEIGG